MYTYVKNGEVNATPLTSSLDITWTRRSAAACKKFRRKWTKSECVDEQRQCTLLMGIMRRRVAVIVVTEVFLANMYYFSPSYLKREKNN